MAKKYLELFLACNSFFFYKLQNEAEKEADKIREKGKRAEIYKERGQWTVFIFNN